MAQSVEHVIGNDEVISSILITSSKTPTHLRWSFSLERKIFCKMIDILRFLWYTVVNAMTESSRSRRLTERGRLVRVLEYEGSKSLPSGVGEKRIGFCGSFA